MFSRFRRSGSSRRPLHNYEVVLGIKYGTEAELSMEGVKPPLSRFREYIINSVFISGSTTLINITAGMLAAYALVRLRFRGKELVLVGMLFTRMVPPIMLILPIFLIWRQLGLLGTYHGLALAYLSFGLPFSIWMMRGYLLDIPADSGRGGDGGRQLAPGRLLPRHPAAGRARLWPRPPSSTSSAPGMNSFSLSYWATTRSRL